MQLWSEEMSDISSSVAKLRVLGRLIFKGMWSSPDLLDLQQLSEFLAGRVFIWRSLVEPEISASNIARRRMSSHSSTDREAVEVKASVLTYLRWLSLSRGARLLETFVINMGKFLSSTPEELNDLSDILEHLGIFQLALCGDGVELDRESHEILMLNLRDCVMEESLGFPIQVLNGLMESVQTPEELYWMSLTGRAAWPTSSRYWTDTLSRCQSREDLWSSEQGGFLSPASFVLFSIMEGMDSGLLFADDFETSDSVSSIED